MQQFCLSGLFRVVISIISLYHGFSVFLFGFFPRCLRLEPPVFLFCILGEFSLLGAAGSRSGGMQ